MKAANLVNQQFSYLTVVARHGSQNNKTIWKCKCKCGNQVYASTGDLRAGKVKSCGCKHKDNGKAKIVDETGNTYGRLTVIEQAGSNKEHKALWKCICQCGQEVIVTGKNLRTGATRSCGCLISDVLSDRSLHDLTGQRFGRLTVIERAATKYSKAGNMATRWKCICDCGNETIVYANALATEGHTRSCGCMKTSFREEQIANILKLAHVRYIREYSFDNLLSPSGTKLRFDFALLDEADHLLCLIEHQGEQHFIPSNNGFGKLQREVTDELKRTYCLKHCICLYEINYDEPIVPAIKSILQTIEALHVNSVPSTSKACEGETTIP